MSNFMQNVKRKWNIQKLGVQLVGIDAMAYYLLVGVSGVTLVVMTFLNALIGYALTNSDYTVFTSYFAVLMLASSPLYWVCKDIGEKRKKKLMADKKGAVHSMEILAILPIQKREGIACNFYRWFLVNILNVVAIVYIEIVAMKYGMAAMSEEYFVIVPLLSMFIQSFYWIVVILNRRWIFLISSALSFVFYLIFLFGGLLNIFEQIARKDRTLVYLQLSVGTVISLIALLWLLSLTVAFYFLNKKNQAWME